MGRNRLFCELLFQIEFFAFKPRFHRRVCRLIAEFLIHFAPSDTHFDRIEIFAAPVIAGDDFCRFDAQLFSGFSDFLLARTARFDVFAADRSNFRRTRFFVNSHLVAELRHLFNEFGAINGGAEFLAAVNFSGFEGASATVSRFSKVKLEEMRVQIGRGKSGFEIGTRFKMKKGGVGGFAGFFGRFDIPHLCSRKFFNCFDRFDRRPPVGGNYALIIWRNERHRFRRVQSLIYSGAV